MVAVILTTLHLLFLDFTDTFGMNLFLKKRVIDHESALSYHAIPKIFCIELQQL